MNWLDRYFGISGKASTVKTEILAGIATFLTMAYIIAVNPGTLSAGGPAVFPVAVLHDVF